MRQETKKIVRAFINGESATAKRTTTDGQQIKLHGHVIAWRDNGRIKATLAGWPTSTTRERLNGLAQELNGTRPFHQRDYVQYYGNEEIGSNDIVILK